VTPPQPNQYVQRTIITLQEYELIFPAVVASDAFLPSPKIYPDSWNDVLKNYNRSLARYTYWDSEMLED
jgi:hypothetical protein